MITLLSIAAGNLRNGGRRIALLAAALAVIALVLVMATALFQGVTDRLTTYGRALHAGDVTVHGYTRDVLGRMAPVLEDASAVEAALAAALPGVEVVPRQVGQARVFRPGGAMPVLVFGVSPARERRLWEVLGAHGLQTVPGADELPPDGIILFAEQAADLGVAVGDRITLWAQSARGVHDTAKLQVWGIANDVPLLGFATYAHEAAVRQLFDRAEGSASLLLGYLPHLPIDRSPALVPPALAGLREAGFEVAPYRPVSAPRIREDMERSQWRGTRLAINAAPDQLDMLWWRWTAADGLTLALVLVLGAIAVVGVTNVVLVSITQRTRELGTMRALGTSRRRLVTLLVLEGLLLGLAASATGACVGAGLCWAITQLEVSVASSAFREVYFSDVLSFSLTPRIVLRTVIGISLATAAASVLPAWGAARMSPALALRHAA